MRLGAQQTASGRGWTGELPWRSMVAGAAACLVPALAMPDGVDSAAMPSQPRAPRQHASLEERVRVLSKALDLDEKQRLEVGQVLEAQRDQVGRLWGDASMPAAYRISATQAISDKTADRIRALLNDEQKRKYNAPRRRTPSGEAAPQDVEAWMRPLAPSVAASSPER